jgi:hypothetical protein
LAERFRGYDWYVVLWRAAIIVGHVAFALTASFVLGGGLVVLMFFAVWWLVWLAFSLFGAWADRVRRGLLERPSSS